MRLFHVAAALAAILALTVTASAADPVKKAQKKAGAVAGVVSEIKKDDGKNAGSLTIKTLANKKNPAAAAGEEKKFVITEATKFEKAPVVPKGQKAAKDQPGTPATFTDLKTGDRVAVFVKGDTVEKVVIGPAKKAK